MQKLAKNVCNISSQSFNPNTRSAPHCCLRPRITRDFTSRINKIIGSKPGLLSM